MHCISMTNQQQWMRAARKVGLVSRLLDDCDSSSLTLVARLIPIENPLFLCPWEMELSISCSKPVHHWWECDIASGTEDGNSRNSDGVVSGRPMIPPQRKNQSTSRGLTAVCFSSFIQLRHASGPAATPGHGNANTHTHTHTQWGSESSSSGKSGWSPIGCLLRRTCTESMAVTTPAVPASCGNAIMRSLGRSAGTRVSFPM